MRTRLWLCLAALPLGGCAGKMAFVGFDGNGKSIEAYVDEKGFSERLTEALTSVRDSVTPALDGGVEGDWRLRTVVVGFGVKGEAGIGPFKVAVKPRVRAAFTNCEDSPIP